MGTMSEIARRFRQLNMLISPPPQLRRKYERFGVSADIQIETEDGGVTTCRTIDISNGGIFVEPPLPIAVGERIYVSVGILLRRVEGVVLAHRDGGSAIRFASADHGALLTAWLLEKRSADPLN